jgi:kynurenine formamidase
MTHATGSKLRSSSVNPTRCSRARTSPALEKVAALEHLPAIGFEVVALPMKIRGGSGGPVRIVALLR